MGRFRKNTDNLTGGVTAGLVSHHDLGNLGGMSVTIVIEEILHDVEDQRLGQGSGLDEPKRITPLLRVQADRVPHGRKQP